MALQICGYIAARTQRAVCILLTLLFTVSLMPLRASAVTSEPVPASTVQPPINNPNPVKNTAASNTASLVAKSDRPLWIELTPTQQLVLAPLAPDWNKLDSNHKRKWIAISNKYPSMSPEQQKRLQDNIRDWAKLTPEQHQLARESYARAKRLNAEQKTAQWQQYQQLPEEQKKKLAADAANKKHIANVPSLQNKPKPIEPLKSFKKAAALHNSSPTASSVGASIAKPGTTAPVAPASSASPISAASVETTPQPVAQPVQPAPTK